MRCGARAVLGLRLGLLLACGILQTACLQVQLFGGPPKPLEETVVLGKTGPKILMIPIDGVITLEEPSSRSLVGGPRESMVSRIREALDDARDDAEVRALLLRIDSPGGTAAASDVVYSEILRFKRERKVPVVAHLIGTAASGGYYVAMSADYVVAHPTTVTGSIGVVFLGVNFVGLMEKLGIENQTLTAGAEKDAGSPLRRMTREEKGHLQSVLDDLHARFQKVVVAGRPELDVEQVEKLSDGRIYSASQALQAGLVDELGDMERAVVVAKQRAGLTEARVVTYHRPTEYANNLFTQPVIPTRIELALPAPFAWLTRPGFYYLWEPSLD